MPPKNATPVRRKVFRDNIRSFTKPMFQRMVRVAGHPHGVTRSSRLVYEELRGQMRVVMETIIQPAVTFMDSKRMKTVTDEMVSMSLELTGMGKMYGGASKTTKMNGTSASDLIGIPFAPFDRLTREVTSDYATDRRWTGDAMRLLKTAIEHILTSLVSTAAELAAYAKRQTLMPVDIQMAVRMTSGCPKMKAEGKIRYAGNGLGLNAGGYRALRAVEARRKRAKRVEQTLPVAERKKRKSSPGAFTEKSVILPGKGVLKLKLAPGQYSAVSGFGWG